MIVDFNLLPDTSRFWIFTANQKLSAEQIHELSDNLSSFLQKWTAHKADLNASFDIIENSILIIAVDESQTGASGCSIDSMTKEVKRIADELKVDFLNRFSIVLKTDNEVMIANANHLKSLLENNQINPETIVSNSMVNTFGELKTNLFLPIKETWMNRYLN
jgi:hypothetical protein